MKPIERTDEAYRNQGWLSYIFFLDDKTSREPITLEASWKLETGVKLPWRPYITLIGRTEYTVEDCPDELCSIVTIHEEFWSFDGFEGIKQLFAPGPAAASL